MAEFQSVSSNQEPDGQKPTRESAAHFVKSRRSSLIGAIFLMGTSAIGPGFITQTAEFTVKLQAAFAFGILASIFIDFVVQVNIWRIVTLTQKKAADIANAALPGSGYLLAIMVILGGFAFNIGNIAGAGQGLKILFGGGLEAQWGGLISAILAIAIFTSHRAGVAMDRIMIVLGLLMILLTLYVAFRSHPPVIEAVQKTLWPGHMDTDFFVAITTIVGGTVGGYITYAGAHRLLDSGSAGPEHVGEVTKAALTGIMVTGIMRYVLFLAVLGVVASGALTIESLDDKSIIPAAHAFHIAAGEFGLRMFGLILWAAGITSVIGAAYTSVSFFSVFTKQRSQQGRNIATIIFILISLVIFMLAGKAPANLMVFAGGFNGLILPIGLTIFIYVGWCRRDLMNNHNYSKWLLILAVVVCALTWYMGFKSIGPIFDFLK